MQIVPEGSLTAYQNADVWKKFLTIKVYEPTAINAAVSDADAKEGKAYTINGAIAPEGYKGIVIKDGKKMVKR